MESVLASRSLAEESLQMWDLNKRLEAYLARVKFLEEENEVLKGEVQRLRGSPTQASWRAKCEEQVAAWRAHLDEAFREKHVAELGRAGLCEEVQQVKGRCQKERAAREEAQKLLALSRKELEEEKRSHIWLREKAAQLEKEAEALVAAHQEERARLEQEAAGFTCSLEGGPGTPVAFRAVEVEDYSTRLSDIWRGAVETYKTEVSQLEASFGEVKESLWKATQGNQKAQLQLQSMERELAGLEARKQALEEHLAQQWQLQQGEAEKLQMAVEGLEEEKQALAVQIAQVLEDRRQLMHLKVSLSLEVATYRTLLEAESTRLQVPGDHRVAVRPPDSKLEASKSKRQAVSLERRPLGPQDPRLNSTPFLKGGVAPPLPTDPSGPFAVGIISVLPRSRSPVVREPQRAAAPVLQAQLAQALEGGDAPAFTDATAFQSSSSRQSKAGAASTAGRASQSSVQESPPPFSANSPLLPNVLGASSSSPPPGERREELSAQVGMRMLGRKAGLHQEVEEEEEEEEEPTEEPPWETPEHHHVPYPSQLVTEALEIALQEVRLGEGRFAAGLLGVAEAPSGIPPPPDHSSSVEEGNGAAAASPGTPEEATLELHRRQAEERLSAGLPEGNRGPEDASEANGGPEVCSEQQGEGGVWGSWGAEPPSLQETQLLEEGGSPSAQHNTEGVASDIPVAGKADCCHERRVPEQMQGGRGQPPGAQSIIQRHEPEEGSRGAQSASQLGVDSAAAAAAVLRADQESPSLPADQSGATGPDVEEADGGVEDLEVVSTEALHLSEDEEQRTLSSPSRESEEGDFQAEMLDREFLQTEEFAAETLSPGSHSFYHQQLHFLGAQQEAPEEEASLSQTDFAFPEEEGTQADSTPETSSAEGAVLREGPPAGALSSDPRPMGEEEEEEADVEEHCIWEPQQDIRGGGDFLEEDGAVGEEGTMEKKERATLPHWTPEQPTVLQQENVGSVLRQEISTGEETADGCQGDLPMQQQREEEEIDTKGNQGEQTVEGCQEDLPVGQQMEGEDITTKGKQAAETLEAYQEVLPMEQQMEGEDITMKREQGEKTVEGCQEDLPVEQQTEEVDITTKTDLREGPVEAYQEVLSMQQQMEEEDITTKGDQAEQTVEECQEVLPLEQQIEEEDITTKEDQAEQTVEECQEDLPVEQLMEEKESRGEPTVETCQGDVSVEEQVQLQEEGIPPQGEQPVEVCQGDLAVQQQREEGETPVASPGRERLKREGLTAESEAVQAAETEPKTSLVGVAGPVSCVGTSDVQEKENPEPHPVSTADPSQAGEREEPGPSPLPLRLEHSLPQEASAGPPEVPSGAQGHTAHGAEAESCGGPPEMALSSESDLRLPSGHSGAEASPDASCDSEGTGKELEGSRHVELEETLPDQTPLHLYGGGRLLMPGQGPLPPENEGAAEAALPCAQDGLASAEAAEQVEEVEEAEGPYRPRAERDGAEALEGVGEERDTTEAAPKHNASFHAEGLPASEGLEEAKAETLGLARGLEGGLRTAAGERPCVPDSFPPGAAEAEGLLSHGRGAGEGLAGGEVALEEASRTGFVWGTEGDSVFQPDQLGPSVLPEGFPGGRDSPWEFCEPRPVVSEGSHKVSPLTSVADLGEIVLEEEQSPGSHDDGAESEGLANGGDGSGPCGRAAQPPAPGLGSCGREEPAPQAGWPGLGPGGVALAEPPAGSWKDSDILEIVEQALEFNQEVIKAAEQTAGAEEWAARGEHHHQSSLPFPGAGRSRVPAETPNAPSPDGPPRLWAENNANGLKQDSSLADFTTEILNGIGGLHPDISGPDAGPFREEPVEEEAVDQPFCRQGLDDPSPLRTRDQNPSQAPANEEAPRTGGISSETQEKDALEHQGQEGSGPEKSPFASRMPPAHGRGKEVEREAVSVPPRFGEDILHLEPIQILKFRPEEEEERWSPGDN